MPDGPPGRVFAVSRRGQTQSPRLVGDDDGVVVIPAERAVEVANRAMDVLEKENRIRQEIEEGRTLASVTELLRWEKVG